MHSKSITSKSDATMTTGNDQLLDLFFICNVPTDNKFQLFCRLITQEDVDMMGYFSRKQADNYPIPWLYNMYEFYNIVHYKYRQIEGSTIVDGFHFGTFDSYEDAIKAAKSYS